MHASYPVTKSPGKKQGPQRNAEAPSRIPSPNPTERPERHVPPVVLLKKQLFCINYRAAHKRIQGFSSLANILSLYEPETAHKTATKLHLHLPLPL